MHHPVKLGEVCFMLFIAITSLVPVGHRNGLHVTLNHGYFNGHFESVLVVKTYDLWGIFAYGESCL